MANRVNKRYTTEAAQDAIDVNDSSHISFAATSENADATFTIEGKLTSGGVWHTVQSDYTEGTIQTTLGPVDEMRVNISDLGTSAYVDFELLGDDF